MFDLISCSNCLLLVFVSSSNPLIKCWQTKRVNCFLDLVVGLISFGSTFVYFSLMLYLKKKRLNGDCKLDSIQSVPGSSRKVNVSFEDEFI